jgi:hypothetical protein
MAVVPRDLALRLDIAQLVAALNSVSTHSQQLDDVELTLMHTAVTIMLFQVIKPMADAEGIQL